MADTASLNQLADCYPLAAGFFENSPEIKSSIIINGTLMSHFADAFPIRARLRIFSGTDITGEFFSDQVTFDNFIVMPFEKHCNDTPIKDGYFELSVFSENQNGLQTSYFNDVWVAIASGDGRININYPLMLTRGADPEMVDAATLYYTGVIHDKIFTCGLAVINHFEMPNNYEVTLYSAAGDKKIKCKKTIAAKSVHNLRLTDYFPDIDLVDFFDGKPGLIAFHYKYKMNAFIQTFQYILGIQTGIDHLGLLFDHGKTTPAEMEKDRRLDANKKRRDDGLVCYCRNFSQSQITSELQKNNNLEMFMCKTRAGMICKGCVRDLENISENLASLAIHHQQA